MISFFFTCSVCIHTHIQRERGEGRERNIDKEREAQTDRESQHFMNNITSVSIPFMCRINLTLSVSLSPFLLTSPPFPLLKLFSPTVSFLHLSSKGTQLSCDLSLLLCSSMHHLYFPPSPYTRHNFACSSFLWDFYPCPSPE